MLKAAAPGLQSVKIAGEKLGLALHMVSAATVEDFDAALASATRERVDGIPRPPLIFPP
jgi:hypothetical protein